MKEKGRKEEVMTCDPNVMASARVVVIGALRYVGEGWSTQQVRANRVVNVVTTAS